MMACGAGMMCWHAMLPPRDFDHGVHARASKCDHGRAVARMRRRAAVHACACACAAMWLLTRREQLFASASRAPECYLCGYGARTRSPCSPTRGQAALSIAYGPRGFGALDTTSPQTRAHPCA
eukprot:5493047-Pleurochrysis_carterae.AAC.1